MNLRAITSAMILISLLTLCLLAPVGCHQTPTAGNVPPAPSARVTFAITVNGAAHASKALADALLTAKQFVVSQRAVEPGYYDKVNPWLVRLAKANDHALDVIEQAEKGDATADWRGALLDVADAAGSTDPAIWGFKNSNSATEAQIAMQSLKLAITAIANFRGGAK